MIYFHFSKEAKLKLEYKSVPERKLGLQNEKKQSRTCVCREINITRVLFVSLFYPFLNKESISSHHKLASCRHGPSNLIKIRYRQSLILFYNLTNIRKLEKKISEWEIVWIKYFINTILIYYIICLNGAHLTYLTMTSNICSKLIGYINPTLHLRPISRGVPKKNLVKLCWNVIPWMHIGPTMNILPTPSSRQNSEHHLK